MPEEFVKGFSVVNEAEVDVFLKVKSNFETLGITSGGETLGFEREDPKGEAEYQTE